MKGFLALVAALALAACDLRPEHAEWQKVCVESEMVMYGFNYTYGSDGQIVGMTPNYVDECVREEPRCIPGRDGSTVCG